MVVADVGSDVGLAADLPDGACGHLGQGGAGHAVMREARVDIVAGFGSIGPPGSASRKATNISDRGITRSPGSKRAQQIIE